MENGEIMGEIPRKAKGVEIRVSGNNYYAYEMSSMMIMK